MIATTLDICSHIIPAMQEEEALIAGLVFAGDQTPGPDLSVKDASPPQPIGSRRLRAAPAWRLCPAGSCAG